MTERTVRVPESSVSTSELRRIEAQVHGSSVRTRESVQRLVAAGDTPPVGMAALVVHADRAALGLRGAADEIDRLRALLSQPEPSAEPEIGVCFHCLGAGYFDGGDMRDDETCNACRGTGLAEPPRIEDMAEGTTLTGALREVFSDNRPMRLMVVKRRRYVDVVDPEGCFWLPSDIDPSTIRDVTPPEDAPPSAAERKARR